MEKLIYSETVNVKIDELEEMRIEPAWYHALDVCREIIENIPAVDAVPVVRCRDCKEWEPCDDGECGTCQLIGGLWESRDFCSEGERRGKDGEAS